MAEVAAAPAAAAAAVPIPAPSERITHVVGDYVAGLWYGEPPAALPPATSYVLPFERKAGAQQHASELDRAKQDRAEQDIAEAKKRGGVIGSIKATTMSVFSRARSTGASPTKKLARKEKKFNTYFKFAQPETLLYHSKKLRLVNRHNNSLMLGKLWISQNFICFRESLRGAKARTTLVIPVRELACIQRARALKVTEANAVPEFQPYADLDSSADSLLLYMRDRELHQLTGFWDHKSLEDTYHTMDYAWRPQCYARDEIPPAEASGSSPSSPMSSTGERRESTSSGAAAAAGGAVAGAAVAGAAAVPIAAAYHHHSHAGREEVLRTAPPYAATSAAPVVPAAVPPAPVAAMPVAPVSRAAGEFAPGPATVLAAAPAAASGPRSEVIFSEPFVVRPYGDTAIQPMQSRATPSQLPVASSQLPVVQYRALPMPLKSQIENFHANFPQRHVPMPARPPLGQLFNAAEPITPKRLAAPGAALMTQPAMRSMPEQPGVRFEPTTFMPVAYPAAAMRSAAQPSAGRPLTGGMRASYPRLPAVLLRDIRSFKRSRLLPLRVRRAWRSPRFARVLRDIRRFNLRTLRHVPAPIIRSQLPRAHRFNRASLKRASPSLMSAELKDRIRAFTSLNLIANFRHVVPRENRFLTELRTLRVPCHDMRRAPRKQLLAELMRFNHSWLRPARTIRRTYARYLSLDEIKRWNRVPRALLKEVSSFNRSRLRRAPMRQQLPAQSTARTQHIPEFSPVAQMHWWPAFSSAIKQQPMRRLRHVPLPSAPIFRPMEQKQLPQQQQQSKPMSKESGTWQLEAARVIIMEQGPAGLSV